MFYTGGGAGVNELNYKLIVTVRVNTTDFRNLKETLTHHQTPLVNRMELLTQEQLRETLGVLACWIYNNPVETLLYWVRPVEMDMFNI